MGKQLEKRSVTFEKNGTLQEGTLQERRAINVTGSNFAVKI